MIGEIPLCIEQSPRQDPDEAAIEDIRKELLQLPYYGVFDFLAFSYDRGTVVVGSFRSISRTRCSASARTREIGRAHV